MPREDPRYKKKERRKEIFIVVPRRREKIFPFLYFPVRLPLLLLLVLQLQDREDQSGSRCEGISLFFNPIQSSMDGRNEGRGIFFFSFSPRRHTVLLLVKIRRVYSYIKRILRQGTYEISRISQGYNQGSERFFFSINLLYFLPRCRPPWPSDLADGRAARSSLPASLYLCTFQFLFVQVESRLTE